MDKRQRRSVRLSKRCWWAARGALSSSGADTVPRVVFDNVSTNSCKCGGIGVLPVDDKAEVAEVGRNPASLSVWADVVVPESIWGWLKLTAGDDGIRVSPSRSEGHEAKS